MIIPMKRLIDFADDKGDWYETNSDFFEYQLLPMLTYAPSDAATTDCLAPGIRDFILSAAAEGGIKTESQDPSFFAGLEKQILGSDDKATVKNVRPILEIECGGEIKNRYEKMLSRIGENRHDGKLPKISIVIVDMAAFSKSKYGIFVIMECPSSFQHNPYIPRNIMYNYDAKSCGISTNVSDLFSFFLMLTIGRRAWTALAGSLPSLRTADIDGMCMLLGRRYGAGAITESFYDQEMVYSFKQPISFKPYGRQRSTPSVTETYSVCIPHDKLDVIPFICRYGFLLTPEDRMPDKHITAIIDKIPGMTLHERLIFDTECMKSSIASSAGNEELGDAIRLGFII